MQWAAFIPSESCTLEILGENGRTGKTSTTFIRLYEVSTYSMGHKGGKCHQRHLGSGGSKYPQGFLLFHRSLTSLNMEMESDNEPEGEWISPGKDISAIGEVGGNFSDFIGKRIMWTRVNRL